MPQQGFVAFSELSPPEPHKVATQPPAAATADMLPQSTEEGDPGYFEHRGISGATWHPPTGDGSDATRPDASLLGVPPELALLAPIGMGRAVVGAAGAIPRVKAMAGAAAPAVKYEITKSTLEEAGVPSGVATAIALGISGAPARRPSVRPSAAAPAAPAASTPAAPVSPAVPSAAQSAPTPTAGPSSWSHQRIRNEVGLAARRSRVKLSEQEYEIADGMVRQGVSPKDAVETVAKQVAQPQSMGRLKLNVAEAKEYSRLRGQGKTHEEAAEGVMSQRALAKQFGLPSSKQVQSQVAERNATGRWPEGTK